MASFIRLRPTLFDKLVFGSDIPSLSNEGDMPTVSREEFQNFTATNVERFTENSLRATIRRDLAWLLNTMSFESGTDLTDYPEVRTSTLNFGVRDFSGRSQDTASLRELAREIRDAIRAFEPRLDPRTLRVHPAPDAELTGKAMFVIEAEMTGLPNLAPVRFRTQVDGESAAVELSE